MNTVTNFKQQIMYEIWSQNFFLLPPPCGCPSTLPPLTESFVTFLSDFILLIAVIMLLCLDVQTVDIVRWASPMNLEEVITLSFFPLLFLRNLTIFCYTFIFTILRCIKTYQSISIRITCLPFCLSIHLYILLHKYKSSVLCLVR